MVTDNIVLLRENMTKIVDKILNIAEDKRKQFVDSFILIILNKMNEDGKTINDFEWALNAMSVCIDRIITTKQINGKQ